MTEQQFVSVTTMNTIFHRLRSVFQQEHYIIIVASEGLTNSLSCQWKISVIFDNDHFINVRTMDVYFSRTALIFFNHPCPY